jgi:hypothetical protein
LIAAGVHRHARTLSPSQPHGHGFVAATSVKRAGYKRDADATRFDRLAQGLEHRGLKLRELIQKQHAQMSLAYLAGPGQAAASANQSRRRDAVVWCAKRSRRIQRARAVELAEQAAHLRDLERLVQLQRRQDAGQAAREHRLPCAGRTAQQQVMAARRRDLEGTLCLLLSVDLCQVVLDALLRREL